MIEVKFENFYSMEIRNFPGIVLRLFKVAYRVQI